MEVKCNKCDGIITDLNINVQKDTAYCAKCGSLTYLSTLVAKKSDPQFRIDEVVKGTSYDENQDSWTIEASHKSIKALFLVPFTSVWAGGSLSSIYGSQLMTGNWELQKSLIGVPFLIISVVLIIMTLMSVNGRTVVANQNGKGLIFIGFWSIGWYRRFEWKEISDVVDKKNHKYRHISLIGNKILNFGWGLSDQKRYYLSNAIRVKLAS